MATTQQFVPVEDIKDDLVFLKDGSVSLIISTSAVNFSLLFETEQISIIQSFAGLLNSLSFPIQIVIHSRRLDVSSYLTTLDKASLHQTNPLLKQMILHYRHFVESIIKENNVLDKQFYVCLNVSSVELGILPKNIKNKTKKALTVLSPRRDHLLKQLSRLGLKARQLNTQELIKVFHDIYNSNTLEKELLPEQKPQAVPSPSLNPPPQSIQPNTPPQSSPTPSAFTLRRLPPNVARPAANTYYPNPRWNQQAPIQPNFTPPPSTQSQILSTPRPTAPPFVVEELPDEFGS